MNETINKMKREIATSIQIKERNEPKKIEVIFKYYKLRARRIVVC